MGKYSELINSARKPTNQKTKKPESQNTDSADNILNDDIESTTKKPTNQKAKKPESQNTNSADNAPSDDVESTTKKSRNPKLVTPELQTEEEEKEKEVNICIKVPISKRRYWMSKAKQEGITVTSVIVEALTQKFGKP